MCCLMRGICIACAQSNTLYVLCMYEGSVDVAPSMTQDSSPLYFSLPSLLPDFLKESLFQEGLGSERFHRLRKQSKDSIHVP